MKLSSTLKLCTAVALAFAVTFTACRKNDDGPGDDLRVGNDNAKIQADLDDAIGIVDDVFSQTSQAMRLAGPADNQSVQAISVCGGTVDTSQLQNNKQITILFDGNTVCQNRIRSGIIVAKLVEGNRWKDTNAKLLLTFTNFKVEFVSTSQSFTYNGTKTITNTTGGLIRLLSPTQPTVTHKVRGNMSVTFDDNTTRTWWIARSNTYDLNGGDFRLTSSGDTTISNATVAIGGVNRLGQNFVNEAPTAIVALQSCGWARPVDGVRIHKYNNRTVTVTFGVNSQGNPGGGSCAYGYKVEWTRLNGQTGSAVISY